MNKFGIGTGLDPFYLTSKAVETGLIEDNILTRAHEIAADSVTKITSLVMENLSIVHHMLIFEYTQMTSATQFIAAMGSLLEFAPKTSIVGNVGAGAASLSFVNTTSFASLSVEKSFVYRGAGYCYEPSGQWGIFFTRHIEIQTSDYKVGLEECLEGCENYEWCLAASFEGTWGVCEFYTDWDAFVIRGDNNISDKDVSEGVITIDEVMYGLGCDESGSNSCSKDRVWGIGGVLDHGSPSVHCFSKWNLMETMLGGVS